MIKVNLAGAGRKKVKGGGAKIPVPTSVMPIVLLLIVLGNGGYGYWWYDGLTKEDQQLGADAATAEAQKAKLESAIKQDAAVEARKKALENRVKIIEGLKRNQVSPVVALDILSEAIDKTQYVWLSSLDQNNAVFNMNGIATSMNAIADLVTNLESTGYFKGVEWGNLQESATNFSFSMRGEFTPPRMTPPSTQAAPGGGN